MGLEGGWNFHNGHDGQKTCDKFADVKTWCGFVGMGALLCMTEARAEKSSQAPSIGNEREFYRNFIHVDGLAMQEFPDDLEAVISLVYGDLFCVCFFEST